MNTSSCKLLSNELLDKVRKEAENIGVSKFCKEIGINRVTYYNLNKKGVHTQRTINKFKRYFIPQKQVTLVKMNSRQAIHKVADHLMQFDYKEQRDELIWLLTKAYGEDKLDELLDNYSDCFEEEEK